MYRSIQVCTPPLNEKPNFNSYKHISFWNKGKGLNYCTTLTIHNHFVWPPIYYYKISDSHCHTSIKTPMESSINIVPIETNKLIQFKSKCWCISGFFFTNVAPNVFDWRHFWRTTSPTKRFNAFIFTWLSWTNEKGQCPAEKCIRYKEFPNIYKEHLPHSTESTMYRYLKFQSLFLR